MSTRSPFRVVFVDHTPFAGGGQLVLAEHISELDKAQFEPHVVCTNTVPELVDKYRQAGAVVHILDMPRLRGGQITGLWQLVRAAWQLRRLLSVLNVDLVVTNTTRASYIAWLATLLTSVPVIWWVRDFLYPKRLFAWLRYHPRKIICVSEAIADFYMPAGDKKATVLYVSSNLYKDLAKVTYHQVATKRAEYGIKPRDVVIGYMGRLVEEKGPEDVLDAVIALLPQYPKLHCVVVGTGKGQMHDVEDRIRDKVVASDYADRIHLTGYQSDQALFYSLFDIFVLATRDFEAFATGIVQAMMAGATVVGTNVGGTPELVRQGQTGVLYSPGDTAALTGALQQLLDNPDMAKVLAEEGKRVVMADFKEEQLARKAEAIYLQTIQGSEEASE